MSQTNHDVAFTSPCHGNLRVLPQSTPSQEIRPYYGTLGLITALLPGIGGGIPLDSHEHIRQGIMNQHRQQCFSIHGLLTTMIP